MAVRLQLKVGALADRDRLPDSADTVLVVEPAVGSVARTKGSLYLVVTSRQPGARLRDATRLVAETIRTEYYYDESAGIRQCLARVIGIANKRLAHQRERLGIPGRSDEPGPIGIAAAVVRGPELYVATVGPAQAYLVRQARLSTLPDPNGEAGLPLADLEPDVWRGELTVGDVLCLVASGVVAQTGTEELKDALVTLHPQSAVERIAAAVAGAGGPPGDGLVALEAGELGAPAKPRTLVAVRPPEPLAGAPERSPIPLADAVSSGVADIAASVGRVRESAGSGLQRVVWGFQDRLPRRIPGQRRMATAATRLETQRRAALALLALVAVAGTLVFGVYAFGGQRPPGETIRSMTAAQEAYEAARRAIVAVTGPGIDLIVDDPERALELLTEALRQLDRAEAAGYPVSQLEPLRRTVTEGLDRLYGVVKVTSTDVFTFPAGEVDVALAGLVVGPDGAPYVLDTAGGTVWRIDLGRRTASPVARDGQNASGGTVATPTFLTTGGPDVLILDDKNQLWRWRPADATGKGSLVRIRVSDAANWGDDIRDIATFVANFDAGFYKLYIADVSEQNIMVLAPASDGSGFPLKPTRRLPTDRPIDGITDILIDGDIYVAEDGELARVIPATGWEPELPGDVELRPTWNYTILASPDRPDGSSSRRDGLLYAFDAANLRIVAFDKANGRYVEQYHLATPGRSFEDLTAMLVTTPAAEGTPAILWWTSPTGLHSIVLEAGEVGPPPATEPPGTPAIPIEVPGVSPSP